jgi:glycosyltransferase involved in cell wall biosynthesis
MKITVITVCRNAERTIGDALRSVAQQTFPNIEHLVIDGLSTDGTMDVVRANDGRVARCVSERDGGIYEAMNKGISWATGEFTCFLNADDMYAGSGVLAALMDGLRESGADAAHANLCYVDREQPSRSVRRWTGRPFRPGMFAKGWAPAHPTFVARTELLRELGGFDVRYRLAADFDLMCRVLEVRCVRSTYVPVEAVRMRVGGVTSGSFRNIVRQNREILASLRTNGLSTSITSFAIRKIASRLGQRLDAQSRPVTGIPA